MPKNTLGRILAVLGYTVLGIGACALALVLDHKSDSLDVTSAPVLTCTKIFNGLTQSCPGASSAVALHWESLGYFGLSIATPFVYVLFLVIMFIKPWIHEEPVAQHVDTEPEPEKDPSFSDLVWGK